MAIAIEQNIPLAPLTTWKIGGAAEFFCETGSEEELQEAIAWARERNLRIHILGRGSNVLIADEGLRGLVICLRNLTAQEVDFDTVNGVVQLTVPAGMSLPRLSKVAAQLGFSGYEFYIGIPGTVGGAVVMNAGFGPADERQTANRCTEVRTVSPGGVARWQPYSDFTPIYRHTGLPDSGLIVTAARFALRDRSPWDRIRKETAKHLATRKEKQPLTRPTAGSVFKATADGTPAAVLIEKCGLKGLRVGGAMVSTKHANWIENVGGATAADVLELVERVKETVMEEERVQLVEEILLLR